MKPHIQTFLQHRRNERMDAIDWLELRIGKRATFAVMLTVFLIIMGTAAGILIANGIIQTR